ncbi:hypothetical protein OG21DRAFT_1509853 [Imleria badia]|nr:hypothetical protein OG21DRAFT_1509853 [Imleria badia]
MEPSMLVSGLKSNGDAKETRKVDKMKRTLVDMLRELLGTCSVHVQPTTMCAGDIIFKGTHGKDS